MTGTIGGDPVHGQRKVHSSVCRGRLMHNFFISVKPRRYRTTRPTCGSETLRDVLAQVLEESFHPYCRTQYGNEAVGLNVCS